MAESSVLWDAIEAGRRRLGLNKREYAERVGMSVQALLKIKRGGGVTGDTLAILQARGGVLMTRKLIASLNRNSNAAA